MSNCKVEGCSNAAVAKGLCAKHYMRARRTGDPAIKLKLKPGPKPRPGSKADVLRALKREIERLRAENAKLRQRPANPEKEDGLPPPRPPARK
jgi:hypothetical protein